jgi:CDP-diacylglycerol--glycerol-3-phosphate 3-phosphatidyltransferase
LRQSVRASSTLLLAGLAAHLVGDIADGAVARFRDEETVVGAMLDILCDRLFYATYYTVFAMLRPSMLVAAGIFMFTFLVLDAHSIWRLHSRGVRLRPGLCDGGD